MIEVAGGIILAVLIFSLLPHLLHGAILTARSIPILILVCLLCAVGYVVWLEPGATMVFAISVALCIAVIGAPFWAYEAWQRRKKNETHS